MGNIPPNFVFIITIIIKENIYFFIPFMVYVYVMTLLIVRNI